MGSNDCWLFGANFWKRAFESICCQGVYGTIKRHYSSFRKRIQTANNCFALVNSLDLGHLRKEQLQDIMRDALFDTLELPDALLWHLLKAHFAMDVFQSKTFCSEMNIDKELSSVDGIKILKEIKRIGL